MTDAVVPAVIVSNLPSQLSKNGEAICLALLGSKTGKELGVLFWKVHPSLAKFLVAFKHQEDRDNWHKNSPELKKASAEFKVRSSMIWFNGESSLVMKTLPANKKKSLTRTQLQGEAKKSNSRKIFQDEFEDLDQIFGVFNTKVEDREEDRISRVEANDELTEVSDKFFEESQVENLSVAKTSYQHGEGMKFKDPEFMMPMSDFPKCNTLPAGEILIPLTTSQIQTNVMIQHGGYVEDLEDDQQKVRQPYLLCI